ncbi:hypothetical protein M0R04_05615 [Candidatus Dojkabacteria bacterium]|nr:hypothetical protein [Candidatus Dojkabacteria bacterium]
MKRKNLLNKINKSGGRFFSLVYNSCIFANGDIRAKSCNAKYVSHNHNKKSKKAVMVYDVRKQHPRRIALKSILDIHIDHRRIKVI